jgi:hypothetical protein
MNFLNDFHGKHKFLITAMCHPQNVKLLKKKLKMFLLYVQSFSFKLTTLRSTFLYISIKFSLAAVTFYIKKTVHQFFF